MNLNDKQAHFNNIIKSINKTCHNKCFKVSNINENNSTISKVFDNTCGKICYEKYIYAIGESNSFLQKIGKVNKSEFATKAYELNANEKLDVIFPYGGTRATAGHILNRKYNWNIYPLMGSHDFKPKFFWR